ncbi:hypothetical protein SAMD00019534_008160 [Acytostelium subglobosum LB1]|uniref:hypothetical protein n=1 Tax=Acytostelium subglobosum LB1 TaxID=1410327 RepID=UPI000644AE24|nr:hypothetical protein SAMD00019534_008160 [Acytostelium subglobosum LB1]GAM17641.1 hypothetical protein SAMD00019534_008160 [Acytostelium subglobosum LB1]|eukprot:XP_012758237.1 hypothetical protein SAMD00019534_008160 [Acytostelium subglobosum LB1]
MTYNNQQQQQQQNTLFNESDSPSSSISSSTSSSSHDLSMSPLSNSPSNQEVPYATVTQLSPSSSSIDNTPRKRGRDDDALSFLDNFTSTPTSKTEQQQQSSGRLPSIHHLELDNTKSKSGLDDVVSRTGGEHGHKRKSKTPKFTLNTGALVSNNSSVNVQSQVQGYGSVANNEYNTNNYHNYQHQSSNSSTPQPSSPTALNLMSVQYANTYNSNNGPSATDSYFSGSSSLGNEYSNNTHGHMIGQSMLPTSSHVINDTAPPSFMDSYHHSSSSSSNILLERPQSYFNSASTSNVNVGPKIGSALRYSDHQQHSLHTTPNTSSNNLFSHYSYDAAHGLQLPKKTHRRRPANVDKSTLYCHHCSTKTTPEWRRGPNGPATLCNACGLAFAKKQREEESQKLIMQSQQQQYGNVRTSANHHHHEAYTASQVALGYGHPSSLPFMSSSSSATPLSNSYQSYQASKSNNYLTTSLPLIPVSHQHRQQQQQQQQLSLIDSRRQIFSNGS